MLSQLLAPVYLSSVVVGDAASFRSGHMCRALCCRLVRSPPHAQVILAPNADPLSALPEGFALHHPRALCCSTTGMRLVGAREASAQSSTHAVAWNAGDKIFELIDTRFAPITPRIDYRFFFWFVLVLYLQSLLTWASGFRVTGWQNEDQA